MSQTLNRNRILIARIAAPAIFLLCLFTASYWPNEHLVHEFNDFAGILLLFACIAGRVYSTLFIGGRKNEEMITGGPYSVVRNPLYFFSFLGVLGVGLYSNHLLVLAALAAIFFAVYRQVISREEAFLEEKFGGAYRQYKERVPALIPDVSLYQSADHIEINLKFVHKALKDAVWWLTPIFLFEMVEYLHEAGIVAPVMTLL